MAKKKKVLVLKSVNADMTAHGGFVWPQKGHVEAFDWNPEPQCGRGLHGWLYGEGDGSLGNWGADAKWLVVEPYGEIVNLDGKVKFQSGNVLFCGTRHDAVAYIQRQYPEKIVIGSTLTGGDRSTLTGGDRSTLTGGYRSTLTGGYRSTLTGGDESTLTGGDRSTLTGGDRSTLTGGDRSTLVIYKWDSAARRNRLMVAYVGENGIKPDTPYCLDENGLFVEKT